jgi:N-acetylneuraminate synthase
VPLGASILEKHFTSSFDWQGPDISISVDPQQLSEMVKGSQAIHAALGGSKKILAEEQPTIDFAYACVVTIKPVKTGDLFNLDNLWVKRPGTGEIKAKDLESLFGKPANRDLQVNEQVTWADVTVPKRHHE